MTPDHIYGCHDYSPVWAQWLRDAGVTGWAVTTHAVEGDLSGGSGHDYTEMADYGVAPIARLNYSHNGRGTIPPDPDDWPAFAQRLARFVGNSDGCRWWTVANEVNLAREWGRDQPIMPQDYGHCYRLCYDAIKSAVPDALIAPAAIGPWNVDSSINWMDYFAGIVHTYPDMIDWLNLHTYSRGYGPAAITDRSRMDRPYQEYHNGFQAYKDFLDAVPNPLRSVPVHVTETNGNRPWVDANTGWVQAAYAEINHHNQIIGSQKIHSLCLFRWPRFDEQWQFETKSGVHEDFRAALTHAYRIPATLSGPTEPAGNGQAEGHTLHIPKIGGGNGPSEPDVDQGPREWDPRLTARQVELMPCAVEPGHTYWRLVEAEYWEEKEHIFVETLDEQGDRLPGVTVRRWNGGVRDKDTELKPNDRWMLDFPMHASGRAYGVKVVEGISDEVFGMGLGSVEQPDMGIHVSYKLVFQRTRYQPDDNSVPQPTATSEQSRRADVPELVHPVADPRYRRITQPYGVNREHYENFRVDGVPLQGHTGTDFATPMGADIRAVDAGTVVESAHDEDGYGDYIKLAHGWGESLYAHLSRRFPDPGWKVMTGQLIGVSGNSGNSTGPHLHFALRVNPFNRADGWGGFSDPLPYLPDSDSDTNPSGNPSTSRAEVRKLIKRAASEFGVEWPLFASLVWAESSNNPDAESHRGAQGLAQITPPTWAEWAPRVGAGDDPFDARDNLRVGSAYLRWLLDQLGNEWSAVVAYNFGIGNVLDGNEPPEDTVIYVRSVIHGADLLREWMGE